MAPRNNSVKKITAALPTWLNDEPYNLVSISYMEPTWLNDEPYNLVSISYMEPTPQEM